MSQLGARLKKFLRRWLGAGSLEYALIISLIAVPIVGTMQYYGAKVSDLFAEANRDIDSAILVGDDGVPAALGESGSGGSGGGAGDGSALAPGDGAGGAAGGDTGSAGGGGSTGGSTGGSRGSGTGSGTGGLGGDGDDEDDLGG